MVHAARGLRGRPASARILTVVEELVRIEGARLAAGDRTVLSGASWRVRRGDRWAVWGPNGAGKSSLLALVRGASWPDEGTVRRAPGLRVTFVDQRAGLPRGETLDDAIEGGLARVRAAEAAVRAEERRLADGVGDLTRYAALQEAFERTGGYRAEARLRRELDRLLPGRPTATPLASLSSGERRRVALALALADRPELLLLDEPTNGLDATARRWLANRLAGLPADVALIVASHDRELLARVSNASAHVSSGRLETTRLPFDSDRERRGVLDRSAAKRRRVRAREASRLAAAAEQARRHGSPTRAAAARALSRRAARIDGAAADAAAAGGADGAQRSVTTDSAPDWTLAPKDGRTGPLLRAANLSRAGLFDDVALGLDAGEKLVLLGPNGSGKSTLLAMLAAEIRSDRPDARVWLRPGARVHWWDAHARGLGSGDVTSQLTAWVTTARAASLAALVRLPRDRWGAPTRELSGGERARAGLALLIASEPDLVLLDEPETDLDIEAIELLEQALAETSTAVVLATHDLRLADAVGDEVRSLHDGRLVAWRGGVDGWLHGRRRRDDEPAAAASIPLPRFRGEPREPGIAELEEEQAEIEARLEDPTRLTERELERLEARSRALVTARMAAYDAVLPQPAPRYRAIEPPLTLHADASDEGLSFSASDWPSLPRIRRVDDLVHLILPDPERSAWLPWARSRALRACLALVFQVLAPTAVQTRAGVGPPPAPFEALDADWWVATRSAWERSEGIGSRRSGAATAYEPRPTRRDEGRSVADAAATTPPPTVATRST